MAKPRNRPDAVSSTYFEGVTPLWVAPGRAPIPERYHAASFSLADWAGPSWPDNAASGFFPLRHFLIEACAKWQAHDWQADRDQIAARKQDARHRPSLVKATQAFRQAIGRSSFRRAERELGVSIAAEFCPHAKFELEHKDSCNAVANALRELEKRWSRVDRSPVRFGPLLYDTIPRLPEREIAVALVLADLVTGFRKDEHRAGGNHFPRPAVLSPKLPWKAIAEFATAYSDDPEASINPDNVAMRVRNLRGKVAQIMRYP
ncbi:hypothetical protein [Parerythrobacter jejuensis]|uniref:Uncharacterized protein n=1 Tax=Parerythrobacter jejuensis TaxID=795812 RepID=A0A845AWX1_9SPHN|nr:hypothetical protein [Parerythrobacter jejuensis]MXP31027.1 hypothetical protein [Parerythrobacter jejuensis]MXP33787.1 hypothetical protein [Parerythrobacter jejuensis]